MRKLHFAFAAGAVLLAAAAAPAVAQDTLGSRVVLVTDLSRDVDALSAQTRTEARIVRSTPAEMPAFEQLANIGGTVRVEVDLDARGSLTNAALLASSGRARFDRSALEAVRSSTYQAASMNGHAVGGRYVVEVDFDPSN
ncbi:MAG: energy transducer TonB [Candidatus Velthaea sp.]|jgi:protein TonB